MKKIEQVKVYIDNSLSPKHLAVRNEHNQKLRPICGEPNPGTRMVDVDPTEVHLDCDSCQEQLEMWKRVKSDG